MIETAEIRLKGCRLLVVEDEYMLASDVAEALGEAGAEVLGPFSSVGAGLDLMASGARPDGALLDVNLHGVMVWPLVDILLGQNVPVVLVTGYDSRAIPHVYADLPQCQKPTSPGNLARALARRIAAARESAHVGGRA